jgi:hypothetical protein
MTAATRVRRRPGRFMGPLSDGCWR